MSQEAAAEVEQPRPKRRIKTVILTSLVGLASAATGFAIPQMLDGNKHEAPEEAAQPEHLPQTDHGQAALKYVPFGEVVANLDDNRMMRYVRAKFSLAVEDKDAEATVKAVEEHRSVLKNWLIGYLQNKHIDEVRGTEGFNRIRREIQEQFNELTFAAGEAKIRDVLFDEFNVQ